MFKVHINNNSEELPSDDILYIVAKEGIFLKKKLGIMESVAPVKNISTLESISSYAKMHINKIPSTSFAKVVDFFRKVYKEYSGEAIVLLFYNENTGKYRIIPPHQKVSGASLEYNRGVSIEGWTMIGTIHSHGSMSAFHSGTDHDDEQTFDGLHITVGRVMSDKFSLSASIIANGYRTMVDPEEYINGIKKVSDFTEEPVFVRKVYKYIDGKFQVDEKESLKTSTTKFNSRYISLAPESKSVCNPKWLSVVEKLVYRGYQHSGYGYNHRFSGYGANYDPHAWHQVKNFRRTFNQKALPGYDKELPLSVVNQMIIDGTTEFGNIFDPTDLNSIPCLTCKFREQKILLEQEEDEFTSLFFKCKKCDAVFSEDDLTEQGLKCPQCKTDDHLEVIDDSELDSHYQPAKQNKDDFQPDQQEFHICKTCGISFLRLEYDTECPYCKSSLSIQKDDLKEDKYDSSEYLTGKTTETHEEFIKQASEPKQIPIPGKRDIPISESSSNSLKSMFRKVFGKGFL